MNTYLLIFVILSFVSYLSYVIIRFGVLKSISESYYKVHKALFTLWIWSIAFPLCIVGATPLMFLAGGFLMFVGCAPAFKEDFEKKIHVIGASVGIVLGFASMGFDFGLWYLIPIMFLFELVMLFLKPKNSTWWIEVASFVLIIIGIAIAKI